MTRCLLQAVGLSARKWNWTSSQLLLPRRKTPRAVIRASSGNRWTFIQHGRHVSTSCSVWNTLNTVPGIYRYLRQLNIPIAVDFLDQCNIMQPLKQTSFVFSIVWNTSCFYWLWNTKSSALMQSLIDLLVIITQVELAKKFIFKVFSQFSKRDIL